jgi:hypothetical protein
VNCVWDNQHVWELSVEEGQVSLVALGCGPGCTLTDALGDEMEWLTMPPIRVHLRVATDCPAYETDGNGVPLGPPKPYAFRNGSHAGTHGQLCDCNRWPCAVPLLVGEDAEDPADRGRDVGQQLEGPPLVGIEDGAEPGLALERQGGVEDVHHGDHLE